MPAVATAFDAALATLIDAGALVIEVPMPVFDRQADYFRAGGFAGAEAYSIHKPSPGAHRANTIRASANASCWGAI